MDIAIYTPASGIPPEAEAIAEETGEDEKVLFRNGSAWHPGEFERVGKVYAHQEEIREAYEEQGIPAEPLFTEPEGIPEDEREEGKDFYVRHKGGRYFNVVSEEGEPVNDKGLSKEEAQELRDELNADEAEGEDA